MCKSFFTSTMAQGNVHHGRNLRKFREWRDMKQETLAYELGDDWTQKKISTLERKEEIEPVLLQQLSKILTVPVELFDMANDDPAVNIVNSTFTDSATYVGNIGGENNQNGWTFNPVEKWMEAMEENKRLQEENRALYERLLKEKDEAIIRLDGIIKSINS
ncbi:XRE family transcriptional regulator [Chitinophagaceae bacterium MMS25-I14]